MIFQENYNTPVEYTPGNNPFAHYERNPFQGPLVKVCLGVCSKGVLKQP